MTEKLKVDGDYIVHFDLSEFRLSFDVFPIQEYLKLNCKSEFRYIDKENEPASLDIFDKEKALKKLSGSFCWKGCWEGRLYFTDEEYWGEEIKELSDLYNNHIVPFCKNFIKKRDNIIDDE